MRCECCGAYLVSTDGRCGYCGTVFYRGFSPPLTTAEMKIIRQRPRPLPTSVPGPGSKVSR